MAKQPAKRATVAEPESDEEQAEFVAWYRAERHKELA